MQKVNDPGHFNRLVNEVKSKSAKVNTNCYLNPIEIDLLTGQNKIYFEEHINGILFLIEEQYFFRLFFYLSDSLEKEDGYHFEMLNQPVIIDLISNGSKQSSIVSGLIERWSRWGFRLNKTYKHMVLVPGSLKKQSLEKAETDSKYKVTFGELEQIIEIIDLWSTHLDIHSISLPNTNELQQMIENREILCAIDFSKKVASVLWFQPNGKTAMIRHVVTHEKHRHHGLARSLFKECLVSFPEIEWIFLWVEESNKPAITLYQDFGFTFDGKQTKQLLLN